MVLPECRPGIAIAWHRLALEGDGLRMCVGCSPGGVEGYGPGGELGRAGSCGLGERGGYGVGRELWLRWGGGNDQGAGGGGK